jgi:ABC-type lipoprotein export system ATPase subunit
MDKDSKVIGNQLRYLSVFLGSGMFVPGMNAIMGPTGSGKTT